MKHFPSIKKNREFQELYYTGACRADKLLVMYAKKNHEDHNRIGISVSKKVGNSVVRHHLVRVIRECFRLNDNALMTGYDLVVVTRPSAKEADYKTIESAYLHLCGLHHILKESK